MTGQLAYHHAERGHHLASTGKEMEPVKVNDEKLYFYILNGEVRSARTRVTLNREYDGSQHEVALENTR